VKEDKSIGVDLRNEEMLETSKIGVREIMILDPVIAGVKIIDT